MNYDRKMLDKNILDLMLNNEYTHIGHILQSMNISITDRVPTAGVNYDAKLKKYNLYVNSKFMSSLTNKEQVAVMIHEIDHILHNHVFNPSFKDDAKRWNIAMDLVINQGNEHIPRMAMKIENFKDKDGNLFPANKPNEFYYALLKEDETQMKVPDEKGDGKEDDQEQGEGNGQGKWVNFKEWLDKQEGQGSFDSHDWDQLSEGDKKEAMDALKDLLKSARKRVPEYSKGAQVLKDKLEVLDIATKKLDFKSIVRTAIKRSLPANNFMRSYMRPNRRLGVKSAGKVVEVLPKITFLMDTSGSIDMELANEFMNVVNEFLGLVSKAELHFFHTQTYKKTAIKKGHKIKETDMEAGGTDLTHSFQTIIKEKSDLVVVLTDGYFDTPQVDHKKVPKTVFIVKKDMNTNHPWADKFKTYTFE